MTREDVVDVLREFGSEDMADEVIRLREQLAAIDTLHKQWAIKFLSGRERSKGVQRLVDALTEILHTQEEA
jgi:hypothetical protein